MKRLGILGILAALVAPCMASAQATPDGYKALGILECKDPLPGSSEPRACRVVPNPASAVPAAPMAAGAVGAGKAEGAAAQGGAASGAASDQSTTTSKAKATSKDAFQAIADLTQVELSVPASPAFAVLGITPDKVQRPGSVRDFVGSVVHGLGKDGKPVNGVAIDISPASVFFKSYIRGGTDYAGTDNPGHSDFKGNYLTHLLARTTVSLASTSADSNGASKSAWGMRVGLIDFGDPGLYAKETAGCLQSVGWAPVPVGRTAGEAPADTSINACDPSKNSAYSLWAKPALYAGYGRSWYSKSGSLTDHLPDVKAWWLSGSYGFAAASADGAQALSSLRTLAQVYLGRRTDDRTADPANSANLLRQNTTEGVFRLKVGKDTWHGFAEIGRSKVRLGNDTSENIRHTALGAEFKLSVADDSWLQLASVNERGFSNGKDKTGVTLSFKLGVPFLSLPGPQTAEK